MAKKKRDNPLTRYLRSTDKLGPLSTAIRAIKWSPNGDALAVSTEDGIVTIWKEGLTDPIFQTKTSLGGAQDLAWAPDNRRIVIPGGEPDFEVQVFSIETGSPSSKCPEIHERICSVAWAPSGKFFASAGEAGTVKVSGPSGLLATITDSSAGARTLAWNPTSSHLAVGSHLGQIDLYSVPAWNLSTLVTQWESISTLAWLPDGKHIIVGCADYRLRILDAETRREIAVLEGHTAPIVNASVSPDGQLVVSSSADGTIRFWLSEDWIALGYFAMCRNTEPPFRAIASFHPSATRLSVASTLVFKDAFGVTLFDFDPEALIGGCTDEYIRYTSAKIALVGESNVGKSCLAQRLAENTYPKDSELGTTHGMRLWQMDLETQSRQGATERRELFLWDMGGQREYRLVHQLFLHDTAIALLPFDPTRGKTAYEDVEEWNKRLVKQLRGAQASKILVGTKMDTETDLVDRTEIERLCQRCGIHTYLETSALTGRGVDSLRAAIYRSLDWSRLASTRRPRLFQWIRDDVERRRAAGEVVLLLEDLKAAARQGLPGEYSASSVDAVATQLALQGSIAQTRLATGEQAIVLQVAVIEKYAGALIVAARKNPHRVPALELRQIGASDIDLPGISGNERLPRLQERIVLECVVQLLIEHWICFEHEGLLIFPTLLKASDVFDATQSARSVCLFYDFSGAIDNIYASLIAWLVIAKNFCQVRLGPDFAEFEKADSGVCGVRKVERRGGFAHLDVYFEQKTAAALQREFIGFVDDHLKRNDIEVVEHIDLLCAKCRYEIPRVVVQQRIARGENRVTCPVCESVLDVGTALQTGRSTDEATNRRVFALRTEV